MMKMKTVISSFMRYAKVCVATLTNIFVNINIINIFITLGKKNTHTHTHTHTHIIIHFISNVYTGTLMPGHAR